MRVTGITAVIVLSLITSLEARGAPFDLELDTRPWPAPVAVVFSADNVLCKEMTRGMRTPERLNNHKIVPPVAPPDDAIWDLFSERWDMPGGAAATEAYSSEKIDLDNDGQVEAVYSFHSVTRYRIADILFVSPNANVAASWPVVTVESLFEASPYIFPHSAAVCAFQPCKGEDAKVFRLRNYRHKGEWIDFRLRYLNVWPFVWRKSAYLLLFSAEEYIKTSAVIRLEKARRVSEVCIFQEEE